MVVAWLLLGRRSGRTMSIPPDGFISIPTPLHVVMWLEFLLFVPFSLSHYCGPFKETWASLSSLGLARTIFWSGEMLNGVGAWVLMFMLGSALWQGTISLIEIEILFLSHALWYGVIIAMTPPWPANLLIYLVNPHTYLFIGVVVTGWGLPRPICVMLCVFVVLFGIYRRVFQVPAHCWNLTYASWKLNVVREEAEKLNVKEYIKLFDMADKLLAKWSKQETPQGAPVKNASMNDSLLGAEP